MLRRDDGLLTDRGPSRTISTTIILLLIVVALQSMPTTEGFIADGSEYAIACKSGLMSRAEAAAACRSQHGPEWSMASVRSDTADDSLRNLAALTGNIWLGGQYDPSTGNT